MNVRPFVCQDDDAPEFFTEVRACIDWATAVHKPPELLLIKIDNWFGPNWLKFSGKVLGQLGVWRSKLTIPPFVPHRVMWERRFVGLDYHQVGTKNIVHIKMPSQRASRRLVAKVAPNASLVWFSGDSLRTGRGAIMAYLLDGDSYWTWYTGWKENREWQIVEAHGITMEEFAGFRSFS